MRITKNIIFVMFSAFIFGTSFGQINTSVYDFEGLSVAPIHGQDNWDVKSSHSQVNNGNVCPPALGTALDPDVFGSSTNGLYIGSQALRNRNWDFGNQRSLISRVDNGSWSLPMVSGNEYIILEWDFNGNWWGKGFYLAYDHNGDNDFSIDCGSLDLNEQSIGISTNPGNVRLHDASGAIVATDARPAEWVRYRMFIDLTANAGQGSINVCYRELGNSGNWTSLANMQNINAGFNATATDQTNPSNLNGMLYNQDAGGTGYLDNILISTVNYEINDTIVCNTPSVTLGQSLNGATYLWSDGSTTPTITVTQTGNYFVDVTLGDCITFREYVTATFNTRSIDLGNDTTICDGAVLMLDAGLGFDTYDWSTGDQTQSITANSSNIYIVEASFTGNLCPTSDTIEVLVETPVQLVTFVDIICNGDNNGEIHIDNSLATEYSIDGGITWQIDSFFVNLQQGNYDVCSRTALGCSICENIVLTDPVPVIASVSPDITICENGSTDLVASAIVGTIFTYHWDFTTNTNATQTVSPAVTMTYNVFAENEIGCLSVPVPVTVTLNPPLNGTISPDITICQGDQVQINATSGGGMGAPYTFTWSNGDMNSTNGTDQITVSPTDTTQYTVTITDNCESTPLVLTMVVNVSPLPIPQYIVNPIQCEPAVFEIHNNTETSMSQFVTWIINGVDVYVNQDVIITNELMAGDYDIQMIVVSPAGCVDSMLFAGALYVDPAPIANFNYSPNPVQMFSTDVVFTNGSFGASTYQWYFEDGNPSTSTETNPQVLFPDGITGSYDVILISTSELGCSDTTTGIVIVYQEVLIYAPNTFTPDGDEYNENWSVYMEGVDIYDFDLLVFNRWGELIWESHDINIGWDGTYKGVASPTGIYTWVIRAKDLLNDAVHSYNGHISLLR